MLESRLLCNDRKRLQDGCRDEHRDVRILRAEILRSRPPSQITVGSHRAGKCQRYLHDLQAVVSRLCPPQHACTTCTPRFERGGPSELPTDHRRYMHPLSHPRTTSGKSVDGLEEGPSLILMYKCTSPPPNSRSGSPAIRGRLERKTLAIRRRPWPSVRAILRQLVWETSAIRRRPQAIRGRPRAIRRKPRVIRERTTTGHPQADDLVEQRNRSTAAGGSNITFLTDLVVRSIRTSGSDLGMCENTRNLLRTFLSHTSIWNGCLRRMMAHSVWFSIS